jgi:Ca2+-transporting ATPase
MGNMDDIQLARYVRHSRVFSRVTPENKYRILQILRTKEVVAMTGDGVNDVPALAGAHVGVAMGSGSSIAKDAGDIILLNNDFESIIHAMHEGRVIFSNIRRMLFYLLSTNTGEAVTLVTAIAIGLPAPLLPAQILWANLVTDTSMVIPLGLEPGEKGVMRQKPISPKAPLLTGYIISRIALVAITMAALALSLYSFFGNKYGYEYAQTITFGALIGMQWANAFSARSTFESVFSRIRVFSKAFYIGLGASVVLQCLALFGPLQSFLSITPVRIEDLAVTGILVFSVMILIVEIHKFFGRKFVKDLTN